MSNKGDEFDRRRASTEQVDLLKKVQTIDWAEQSILMVSPISRGGYDFTAGGFLLNVNYPEFLTVERPTGMPGIGIELSKQFLKIDIRILQNQEFANAVYREKPAHEVKFNPTKVFVTLDGDSAEDWTKKFEREGVIVSVLTPVNFFCRNTDGRHRSIPVAGLFCRTAKSALYFPVKDEPDTYKMVASWSDEEKNYEWREAKKLLYPKSDIQPLQ